MRHHVLKTGMRIFSKFRWSTIKKTCTHCFQNETALHLFANCSIATDVWRIFIPLLIKILPRNTPIKQPYLILGIFPNNEKPKNDFPYRLGYTITTTIVYILWKARCQAVFQKKKQTVAGITKEISNNLKITIQRKFDQYLSKSNLSNFKHRFCIGDALCSINKQSQLVLNI